MYLFLSDQPGQDFLCDIIQPHSFRNLFQRAVDARPESIIQIPMFQKFIPYNSYRLLNCYLIHIKSPLYHQINVVFTTSRKTRNPNPYLPACVFSSFMNRRSISASEILIVDMTAFKIVIPISPPPINSYT